MARRFLVPVLALLLAGGAPLRAQSDGDRAARAAALARRVDDLVELAAYLADFRRQEEVRTALFDYNIRKGDQIILAPTNSESVVEELFRHGYLERPGGPPSGEGIYLMGLDGVISSTRYGTRERPLSPPPGLKPGGAFTADPAVVLAALEGGHPAVFEFLLGQLENAQMEAGWDRIARGAAALTDPWAIDVLLKVLGRRARAMKDSIPAPMAPFLHRLAASTEVEPRTRRIAVALLYASGARGFPPVEPGELDETMRDALLGRVPKHAALARLEALGDKAEAYLIACLDRDVVLGSAALRAIPRLGGKAAGLDLVERLDETAKGWKGDRMELLRALRDLTGEDGGEDPGAWRLILGRKFGR